MHHVTVVVMCLINVDSLNVWCEFTCYSIVRLPPFSNPSDHHCVVCMLHCIVSTLAIN